MVEDFDLVREQTVVQNMVCDNGLYVMFDTISRRYEQGLISPYIYEEMKASIYKRFEELRHMQAAEEHLNSIVVA